MNADDLLRECFEIMAALKANSDDPDVWDRLDEVFPKVREYLSAVGEKE